VLLPGVSTDILPSNEHHIVVTLLNGGRCLALGTLLLKYSLPRDVFVGPLPSNGFPSIVDHSLVGTCLPSLCLAMHHNIMLAFCTKLLEDKFCYGRTNY
jgi:hypothetical protein